MYDSFAEPLLGGISAGDGARLSMAAAFPQLRAMEREHRSVIRATRAMRRRPPSSGTASHPAPLVSFIGGMGELVDATSRTIAARASAGRSIDLRTSCTVNHLEPLPGGVGYLVVTSRGEAIAADAVILAAPAHTASGIVGSMDAALGASLREIRYASTVTVSAAYRLTDVPRPLDASGYVVPRSLGRAVRACTWSSAKFTGRAPTHSALFRLVLGGAHREHDVDATDAEILEHVRAEMRNVLGIIASPQLVRIHRLRAAMPQYDVGHLDRVAAIQRRARQHPALFLAGAAYEGIGSPDCIRSGENAAEAAMRSLSVTAMTADIGA
jgi:oxygen-dependent protoporphyrinogen oxidase